MKLRDVLNELAKHQLPLSDVAGAATVPQLSSKCAGRQLPTTAAPAGSALVSRLNRVAARLATTSESDRTAQLEIIAELESIIVDFRKSLT